MRNKWQKLIVAGVVLYYICWTAAVIGGIVVIAHFIGKYW